MKPEAQQCCRFIGILESFSACQSESGIIFGKGVLRLPDPQNKGIAQRIKLSAWEEITGRLAEVPPESWIQILSTYSPNIYKNNLYVSFTVDAFTVLKGT